ncbi:MAG: toprim domain-containing protein [Minisyncoccia bacterium]
MSPFEDLEEMLRMFPGIGPKQAKRFAYFLAHQSPQYLARLSEHIQSLKAGIATCHECFRIFPLGRGAEKIICKTCAETSRDKSTLLVVPRDSDFLHIESSGAYKGMYFLIGNTLSVLDEDPKKHLRYNELCNRIKKMGEELKEVILASDLTPDGDYTIEWLTGELKKGFPNLKITSLGRGLSTGTELEYADPETLKNAIISRKVI